MLPSGSKEKNLQTLDGARLVSVALKSETARETSSRLLLSN